MQRHRGKGARNSMTASRIYGLKTERPAPVARSRPARTHRIESPRRHPRAVHLCGNFRPNKRNNFTISASLFDYLRASPTLLHGLPPSCPGCSCWGQDWKCKPKLEDAHGPIFGISPLLPQGLVRGFNPSVTNAQKRPSLHLPPERGFFGSWGSGGFLVLGGARERFHSCRASPHACQHPAPPIQAWHYVRQHHQNCLLEH